MSQKNTKEIFIKTEFCKNNGIELIRFNYLDSDTLIVDKLKNILNCNVG